MLDPERSEPPPPAEPPALATTFELPSARQVVSAGLQLAVTASKPIRRGSIYIGLLALGAFGPTVILIFLGLARLLGDPETAAMLAVDPTSILVERPELEAPLQLLSGLLFIGLLLLVAISVDAQAIAISLLGGTAAQRPLRLAEAVTRARQTFWRLVAAVLLVGLTAGLVALVVTLPFGGPESNPGVSFIGSMIGALAVTPWAFATTGIVLGDVGAVESLRRSVALYRARRRIALVVVLFTLVTAAIQSFALDVGLDLAVRVGEFFNAGSDQGSAGLVVPAIVVLAFIVAFGSLTFTIAAIVAAPQVVAFLGLTFHSGGLDRARTADGATHGLFHWVAPPMAVAMVGVALIAALGVSMLAP